MHSNTFGEFFGTLILVLLGDGVVAGTLLKRSKAQGAGWLAISTAWGLAVLIGIFVAAALGDTDGHLNPAFTVGSVIASGHAERLWTYIPAQLCGGLCGAILVWVLYLPHWEATEDQADKLACFCTAPAIRSPFYNLVSEVIATFVLVLVAVAMTSRRVAPAGLIPGLSPILIGALVWSIGLSLGGPTGYAINPARDFAPRLAHALLPIRGKGHSDWGYAWIPVIGPILGAILAGVFVRLTGMS